MPYYENQTRFKSSGVVITEDAVALLQLESKSEHGWYLAARHFCGDWGDVSKEEREANERHLKHKMHHSMSVFDIGGQDIWIVTQWDLDVTFILLPDEFHTS